MMGDIKSDDVLAIRLYISNLVAALVVLAITIVAPIIMGEWGVIFIIMLAILAFTVVALLKSPWYVWYRVDRSDNTFVVTRWYLFGGKKEYRVPLSSITAVWRGYTVHRKGSRTYSLYVIMGEDAIRIGRSMPKRRKWLAEYLGREVEETGRTEFMTKGMGTQVGKKGVAMIRKENSIKDMMRRAKDMEARSEEFMDF